MYKLYVKKNSLILIKIWVKMTNNSKHYKFTELIVTKSLGIIINLKSSGVSMQNKEREREKREICWGQQRHSANTGSTSLDSQREKGGPHVKGFLNVHFSWSDSDGDSSDFTFIWRLWSCLSAAEKGNTLYDVVWCRVI